MIGNSWHQCTTACSGMYSMSGVFFPSGPTASTEKSLKSCDWPPWLVQCSSFLHVLDIPFVFRFSMFGHAKTGEASFVVEPLSLSHVQIAQFLQFTVTVPSSFPSPPFHSLSLECDNRNVIPCISHTSSQDSLLLLSASFVFVQTRWFLWLPLGQRLFDAFHFAFECIHWTVYLCFKSVALNFSNFYLTLHYLFYVFLNFQIFLRLSLQKCY